LAVKIKVLGLVFIFLLMFSSALGLLFVDSAKANSLVLFPDVPAITINHDGSVTPQTDLISQNGSTYTLTGDVNESKIIIECSNIVFDGNGYAVRLMSGVENPAIFMYYYPHGVTNVTVKNVAVYAPFTAILMCDCSHCQIRGVNCSSDIELRGSVSNIITACTAPIYVNDGSENNLFCKNNITPKLELLANSNVFYLNNMFLFGNDSFFMSPFDPEINSWDNGTVGNCWSDYATLYPNASEIGRTGIGDTPYVISQNLVPISYATGENPKPGEPTQPYVLNNNIDHYPLLYSWGSPELTVVGRDNASYFESFPLDFTVDKPVLWLGYSLNGAACVNVAGNTTLGGLAPGSYNLTVYAVDLYGASGVSKTFHFTINEPFPIALAAAISLVLITGVGICIVYYRKSHRRNRP
jgi:hypothetical protein